MIKCELMKNNKCVCSHKCAKLIWYEKGRAEREKEILEALNDLVHSEYQTKECGLLASDLLEVIAE